MGQITDPDGDSVQRMWLWMCLIRNAGCRDTRGLLFPRDMMKRIFLSGMKTYNEAEWQMKTGSRHEAQAKFISQLLKQTFLYISVHLDENQCSITLSHQIQQKRINRFNKQPDYQRLTWVCLRYCYRFLLIVRIYFYIISFCLLLSFLFAYFLSIYIAFIHFYVMWNSVLFP